MDAAGGVQVAELGGGTVSEGGFGCVEAAREGVVSSEAGGRFDAVLCDANAHPAKMGRAPPALRPYLAAGATLVLTLKQPSASTKAAAADTGEVEAALAAGGFRDLRTAWLWANGRKERTLAATYT